MLLSFTTLTLLLVQNSFSFSEMTKQMELNLEKNNLIDEVASLTEFITALQTERVTVAQGLFISMSSGGSACSHSTYFRVVLVDIALEMTSVKGN